MQDKYLISHQFQIHQVNIIYYYDSTTDYRYAITYTHTHTSYERNDDDDDGVYKFPFKYAL